MSMKARCSLALLARSHASRSNNARLHLAFIDIDEEIEVAPVVFEPVVVLLLHLFANGERG
jgi:hypothetical protein